MGELVVGAIVTVLIKKLTGELISFARSQGIDSQLKVLKNYLPKIQDVLADAAQKQITREAVELWLVDLQDLVYDIEDVLDDMDTEVMKRNLQGSKVLMMIPTPHTIKYGLKMSSNLDKIIPRLTNLFKQRESLGLKVIGETSIRTNRRVEETTSLLPNVSKVLGREGDKEAMLGKLLGDEGGASVNQNVSVVSIVGLGGIGKTTLARLLYNDPKVKDHFELRAWVCVSDDFDVSKVSKAIYQAVCGENEEFNTLDLLHVALKEKLTNKRFLLVLDDVWDEDHKKWENLEKPLVGAPGSKVIVTTRNTKVALVMNCVQPHNLEVLSDETALSLFARYALEEQNFDKHPSLSTIARDIVEKCGGLPLALVTIGRVLKTKGNDVVEWEALLNSEIWGSHDGNGILPALKLSYYHLPSHLKQLFAYCSLYPKDHEFDKNKLVLKWMAQGFLSQPRGGKTMEIFGHGCFEELRLRCFFQPSTNYESRYTMHDLMNDLAKSVAGKFFCNVDKNGQNKNFDKNGQNKDFEKFRHFSFTGDADAENIYFKELHKARCLRTFLPIGPASYNRFDNALVKLLTQLQFLRVLSLTDRSITKVPKSIGNLKHLRYLNFSETCILEVPKQVGKLYNLQSLLVRDCRSLYSLPRSLVKLKNLLRLDMAGTSSMKKTPLVIAQLTSLNTLLGGVCIERGNGFKISQLKGLSNLQGKLSIKGLDNVIDPTEANDANLQEKEGLDDLKMKWSVAFDASRDPTMEYDVLEKLRPPSKLKKLRIFFYGGMKFPSWFGDLTSFDQLSVLILVGCENCTDLTLGHLRSLRELSMRCMKGVKSVELLTPAKPFHGNAFPSLESLEVDHMQSLEIWSTSAGDDNETPRSFPSLREISITSCPKFGKVSFGLIPSLKDLTVEGCPKAVLRDLVGVSSSICTLRLRKIKGLTQLGSKVLKHLGAVEFLSINGCRELRYIACSFLGSLQKLQIRDCSKLVSLNKGEKEVGIMRSLREVVLWCCDALESYCCPTSVERLEIYGCNSMTSLSFSILQEDLPSSSSSSSLKVIKVIDCENIKSIAHEHLQSFTSLEEMKILKCPNMEDSFPSRGMLWPPNLKILSLGALKKPMSKWGIQKYPPSLVHLLLHRGRGVDSFGIIREDDNSTISSSCFLLPPSLTYLQIWDFPQVESLSEVLQHHPHLQEVDVISCRKLSEDPPETTSWVANGSGFVRY